MRSPAASKTPAAKKARVDKKFAGTADKPVVPGNVAVDEFDIR